MSTYSGFSNRRCEDRYNFLLKEVINLLNQIVITHVSSIKLQPFKLTFEKISKELTKLDLQKYSDPKFSKCFEPLSEHISVSDGVKQWQSEPNHKEKSTLSKTKLRNNFIRSSKDKHFEENRRTISFSVSASNSPASKHPTQKGAVLDYNKKQRSLHHIYEQNLKEEHAKKGRKVYRSRAFSSSLNQANVQNINPKTAEGSDILKNYRYKGLGDQSFTQELTMEELMQRNPLIERKMSAGKKRRYLKVDFPQIREEQNEGEDQIFDGSEPHVEHQQKGLIQSAQFGME